MTMLKNMHKTLMKKNLTCFDPNGCVCFRKRNGLQY